MRGRSAGPADKLFAPERDETKRSLARVVVHGHIHITRVLSSALTKHVRRLAEVRGHVGASGSVTFVQRFGGGLNLNVHYHAGAMASFAERLRGSPCAEAGELAAIESIVQAQKTRDAERGEFAALFEQATLLLP